MLHQASRLDRLKEICGQVQGGIKTVIDSNEFKVTKEYLSEASNKGLKIAVDTYQSQWNKLKQRASKGTEIDHGKILKKQRKLEMESLQRQAQTQAFMVAKQLQASRKVALVELVTKTYPVLRTSKIKTIAMNELSASNAYTQKVSEKLAIIAKRANQSRQSQWKKEAERKNQMAIDEKPTVNNVEMHTVASTLVEAMDANPHYEKPPDSAEKITTEEVNKSADATEQFVEASIIKEVGLSNAVLFEQLSKV